MVFCIKYFEIPYSAFLKPNLTFWNNHFNNLFEKFGIEFICQNTILKYLLKMKYIIRSHLYSINYSGHHGPKDLSMNASFDAFEVFLK
jgi:hypothetical protein